MPACVTRALRVPALFAICSPGGVAAAAAQARKTGGATRRGQSAAAAAQARARLAARYSKKRGQLAMARGDFGGKGMALNDRV